LGDPDPIRAEADNIASTVAPYVHNVADKIRTAPIESSSQMALLCRFSCTAEFYPLLADAVEKAFWGVTSKIF
jgi:hypothetical protein